MIDSCAFVYDSKPIDPAWLALAQSLDRGIAEMCQVGRLPADTVNVMICAMKGLANNPFTSRSFYRLAAELVPDGIWGEVGQAALQMLGRIARGEPAVPPPADPMRE